MTKPRRAGVGLALTLLLTLPAHAGWRVVEQTSITRSGQAVGPVMAPDGRRVAYLVGSRFQAPGAVDVLSGRLWVMDRATGDAARAGKLGVDTVAGEESVAFSPVGTAYAYMEGTRAAPILWYVDDAGGRFRVGAGHAAAFSPDGRYVSYVVWGKSERSGQPTTELWLFDTTSHESKPLTRVEGREAAPIVVPPRFTPDGQRIVFRGPSSLVVYARGTGQALELPHSAPARGFDVLPSGRVVFFTPGGPGDEGGIWSVRPVGRDPLLLFPLEALPPDVGGVAGGPDANTLLFLGTTAAGHGLIVGDVRTGAWRFVAAADAASRQPGGPLVALETAAGGKRNITVGKLEYTAVAAGR